MKNLVTKLLITVVFLVQSLMVLHAGGDDTRGLALTEIIFIEMEPGIESFKSRLLLGEHVLRLDDGDDQGDFILFDRNTHEIHSFNHQDRSHLVMKALAPKAVDIKLDFRVDSKKLRDAPRVNNIMPVQHLFSADGSLCKTSVNVAGLLPEVTQVLIDYEQAIVEQNKQTLSQIPASVRSSCYMANNYLHAGDYLKAGFPLFVIDDQGRQKKLLSFQQVIKGKSIMLQPTGYSLYYPNASNLRN